MQGGLSPRNARKPQAGWHMMREDNLLRGSAQSIRHDHGLESRAGDLPEPGTAHDVDGDRSALGGRHYLYSLTGRVCLSGRDPGRILPQSGGLEAGPHDGQPFGNGGD